MYPYYPHSWVLTVGDEMEWSPWGLQIKRRTMHILSVSTVRLQQNCRHFVDDIFKCIFFNGNVGVSFKISLKLVPKVRINNIYCIVQIMAWHRTLSEPMMVRLPTHICVTRPLSCLWINTVKSQQNGRYFTEDTFKYISSYGTLRTSTQIS